MVERAPAVRALLLDLDGVLTDTAEQHLAAWRALALDEGLAFDPDLAARLRGRSREDSLRLVLGGRTVDDATFGRLLARKNAAYLAAIDGLDATAVLPGAHRLVDDARAAGLAVAVASSSRNAVPILVRLGLDGRFDAVVDGNDVQRAKPAPDVFLVAAERLAVEPSSCLVVEDAQAGVEAAHAAGMRCVGVGPAAEVGAAEVRVDRVADIDLTVVLATLGSDPAG
jgi:beta-phosphoglucomutase